MTQLKRAWQVTWPPLVVIVVGIGLLQWLTSAEIVQDFIVPSPSSVWDVLVNQQDLLAPHLIETANVSLLGLGISIIIGIAVALAMDRVPLLQRAFYPLVVASQTIPTLVITPVIVLIFGFGLLPKLIVVVLVCFFPICISLFQGLGSVDPDQIRLLKTMGASNGQIMRHVKFPGSLPGLFSGLKISATYCVMSAALAEWSGGGEGLGIYMMRTKRSFTYDRMFAAIVLIILLSLAVFCLVALAERICLPWQTAEQQLKARKK